MKIINPYIESITPAGYDLNSIKKHIEICGKVCYKSENNITQDSYISFYNKIKTNKHLSVLEHGTVYLKIPAYENAYLEKIFVFNPYTVVNYTYNSQGKLMMYITTNMRVLEENNILEDVLEFMTTPSDKFEKRYTIKFIIPISISREFVRHRVFSFSEMSTRYCNFTKDKFNNEITFIRPDWVKDESINNIFIENCKLAENAYFELIKMGYQPQQAREVLPLCTKTELIMTGFKKDWDYFFKLRCDKAAHPMAQIIANSVKDIIYF